MSIEEKDEYSLSISDVPLGRGGNVHTVMFKFEDEADRDDFAGELAELMNKYRVKAALEYNTHHTKRLEVG